MKKVGKKEKINHIHLLKTPIKQIINSSSPKFISEDKTQKSELLNNHSENISKINQQNSLDDKKNFKNIEIKNDNIKLIGYNLIQNEITIFSKEDNEVKEKNGSLIENNLSKENISKENINKNNISDNNDSGFNIINSSEGNENNNYKNVSKEIDINESDKNNIDDTEDQKDNKTNLLFSYEGFVSSDKKSNNNDNTNNNLNNEYFMIDDINQYIPSNENQNQNLNKDNNIQKNEEPEKIESKNEENNDKNEELNLD